jgi:endonuclease/exonuclease/phosphatase family metal-dependent hydrolase
MTTRIVFWNLNNLSCSGANGRYRDGVAALRHLANEPDTDVLALVEVGPHGTLADIAAEIGSPWLGLSSTSDPVGWNIGILYRSDRYNARPIGIASRPHYVETGARILSSRDPASIFELEAIRGRTFLLVLVHFKAEDGAASFYTRIQIASWLRLELETLRANNPGPIVIGGDFNGEPYEEMFGPSGLDAKRRADDATRSRGLQIYNPTWRLLIDGTGISALRSRLTPGRKSLQSLIPPGTYGGGKNNRLVDRSLIDGVLVSGEWLTAPHFELLDMRLAVLTDSLWHHTGERGAHHAGRAPGDSITDHLPLAVHLELR